METRNTMTVSPQGVTPLYAATTTVVARSQAAPGTFDEHDSGQLRIGAEGDQLQLLALPDDLIPASDGGALASPYLVPTTTDEGDPNA